MAHGTPGHPTALPHHLQTTKSLPVGRQPPLRQPSPPPRLLTQHRDPPPPTLDLLRETGEHLGSQVPGPLHSPLSPGMSLRVLLM